MSDNKNALRKRFTIHSISNIFAEYNESLAESESNFIKQAQTVLPYTDEEFSKFSREEQESITDWYSDDYIKYSDIFPSTLRNSYLIGYYSIYDYYLYTLCKYAKNIRKSEIDIELLKGEGIWRSRNYLEKICSINISDCPEWNEVININKIRNNFVHNFGIAAKPDELAQYVQINQSIIEIQEHNAIKLKSGYLEHISKIMEKHLVDIVKKIFA